VCSNSAHPRSGAIAPAADGGGLPAPAPNPAPRPPPNPPNCPPVGGRMAAAAGSLPQQPQQRQDGARCPHTTAAAAGGSDARRQQQCHTCSRSPRTAGRHRLAQAHERGQHHAASPCEQVPWGWFWAVRPQAANRWRRTRRTCASSAAATALWSCVMPRAAARCVRRSALLRRRCPVVRDPWLGPPSPPLAAHVAVRLDVRAPLVTPHVISVAPVGVATSGSARRARHHHIVVCRCVASATTLVQGCCRRCRAAGVSRCLHRRQSHSRRGGVDVSASPVRAVRCAGSRGRRQE
jgi:hypothetical protein